MGREACLGRHVCGARCSTNSHVSDAFQALVPRSRSLSPSLYPHAVAIALAERHSWAPADLRRLARRPRPLYASTSPFHPLVALRASRVSKKGLLTCRTRSFLRPALHAATACASWSVSIGLFGTAKVGSSTCRPWRSQPLASPLRSLGRFSPENRSRTSASPVCHRGIDSLAWHIVARGTRTSAPVSMPDVFVPACLTPGTTGLIVLPQPPER